MIALNTKNRLDKMSAIVDSGELFESFQTVADWTGGGATIAADAIHYKVGNKGISLTASVAGGNPQMDKTISKNFSTMNNIFVEVYIPDVTKVGSVTFYLTSNDYTTFYSVSVAQARLKNGMNYLKILKASWAASGAESWANTMILMRCRVFSIAAQVGTATFCSLRINHKVTPSVVWFMDDCYKSAYDKIASYARLKNVNLTFACVKSLIASSASYMTATELDDVYYNLGHDVINHSDDHTSLITGGITDQQISDHISIGKAYLMGRGYFRSANFMAYPLNAYNANVQLIARGLGVLAARANNDVLQVVPANDMLALQSVPDLKDTTTFEGVQAYIDSAILNGMSCLLYGHQVADVPADNTTVSTAVAVALIDYISAKVAAGQLESKTMSQFYEFNKLVNNS